MSRATHVLIPGRLNGVLEKITGFDLDGKTSFDTVSASRGEMECRPAMTMVGVFLRTVWRKSSVLEGLGIGETAATELKRSTATSQLYIDSNLSIGHNISCLSSKKEKSLGKIKEPPLEALKIRSRKALQSR